jgi:hypothetical protein
MINKRWIWKDLEEIYDGLIEILSQYLPWRAEATKNVRIASVPPAIWNEHLPNISLERYCYTSLLVEASNNELVNELL